MLRAMPCPGLHQGAGEERAQPAGGARAQGPGSGVRQHPRAHDPVGSAAARAPTRDDQVLAGVHKADRRGSGRGNLATVPQPAAVSQGRGQGPDAGRGGAGGRCETRLGK